MTLLATCCLHTTTHKCCMQFTLTKLHRACRSCWHYLYDMMLSTVGREYSGANLLPWAVCSKPGHRSLQIVSRVGKYTVVLQHLIAEKSGGCAPPGPEYGMPSFSHFFILARSRSSLMKRHSQPLLLLRVPFSAVPMLLPPGVATLKEGAGLPPDASLPPLGLRPTPPRDTLLEFATLSGSSHTCSTSARLAAAKY